MINDLTRVLLTQSEIEKRVSELAEDISKDYTDKEPVAICILKGASVFYCDLLRKLNFPVRMDFMAISSYGCSTKSAGEIRIKKDIDCDIANSHVLIVEDIIDTGCTLSNLIALLNQRNPKSVKTVCLLDKPKRRKATIQPDYCGFEIEDNFVVGYGLDYAERYRNLPYIGILSPKIYE
ncbi:MAG: hypoxanthine phosphoribosyltransferase [Clostridiales bacterium]|nr:hypoxanthine phosphoribosyltransferase [Clostridiales bacterium]